MTAEPPSGGNGHGLSAKPNKAIVVSEERMLVVVAGMHSHLLHIDNNLGPRRDIGLLSGES